MPEPRGLGRAAEWKGRSCRGPPATQTPPRPVPVPRAPEPSSWAGPGAQGVLGAAQWVMGALP